jgi:hypothetical protein
MCLVAIQFSKQLLAVAELGRKCRAGKKIFLRENGWE